MQSQLEGARKRSVAYGTWKRDEIVWRVRVYPSDLGEMPIDQITEDDCQAWLDEQVFCIKFEPSRVNGKIVYKTIDGRKVMQGEHVLTNKRLQPAGKARIAASVSVFFEIARRKPYRLIKVNPMAGDIELPRETKDQKAAKGRKSLTPVQAASLDSDLSKFRINLRSQGSRFEAMVLFARDVGCRPGEICGLKWDRVHRSEAGPYVQFDIGLARHEGGFQDAATKSGNRREVPITEETYERLMAQPKRSQYVFTAASGKPVSRDNFTRDFRAFRESIGMPNLTPHKLRHTYISLMIRAGADLKSIQKLVGHSNYRMIMEVYGETYDDSMVEATKRFERLMAATRESQKHTENSA